MGEWGKITGWWNEKVSAFVDDREIYISGLDLARLREMLIQARRTEYRGQRYLNELRARLERTQTLTASQAPVDRVTMGSVARVQDLDTQREVTYTLVWPDEANPAQGKVSVLSPIGAALLGRQVGVEFDWEAPEGARRLVVREVLAQPGR